MLTPQEKRIAFDAGAANLLLEAMTRVLAVREREVPPAVARIAFTALLHLYGPTRVGHVSHHPDYKKLSRHLTTLAPPCSAKESTSALAPERIIHAERTYAGSTLVVTLKPVAPRAATATAGRTGAAATAGHLATN